MDFVRHKSELKEERKEIQEKIKQLRNTTQKRYKGDPALSNLAKIKQKKPCNRLIQKS